jgi:Domain of unknown function (DUF4301)
MEENTTNQDTIMKAASLGLTAADLEQIKANELSLDEIERHLSIFKAGISKTQLDRVATLGDGIQFFSEEQLKYYVSVFEQRKNQIVLEKFVPASGAASRMFKFLSEFLKEYDPISESINAYVNRKNDNALVSFLIGMDKLPFFKEIDALLSKEIPEFKSLHRDKKNYFFIKMLLDADKFDFANKPKGVLPFHNYDGNIVSPIEEHLKEAALYSVSNAVSKVHFTISEEHQESFEKIISSIKNKIEEEYKVRFKISFSRQQRKTDTIAVNYDNTIARQNQKIIFRPGGHGALIHNLNKMDADVIFIKNIDNVSHNNLDEIALFKKLLAGCLLDMQGKIFQHLNSLDSPVIAEKEIINIKNFVKTELNIEILSSFNDFKTESQIKYLKSILLRPIRVCGMVKNENEPGGGPFWVRDQEGTVSLQIIESSQIDFQDKNAEAIFKKATHFNPVDIVCGIKNHKGEKFELTDFVNHNTGFIVEKSKNGMNYKAYELPGLWNGAMAKWISVFVEVPLSTFNPVKTVNDLLKPNHQPF